MSYSQGCGDLLLDLSSSLVLTLTIHALQVGGGALQGVWVPQKAGPHPPHYHRLAQLAELLLEDPASHHCHRHHINALAHRAESTETKRMTPSEADGCPKASFGLMEPNGRDSNWLACL